MSKNVNLDDEAIATLKAHKRKGESYSKVVKRLVAPPIRTFGELQKALEQFDGALLDFSVIERIRKQSKRRV